MPSDKIRLLTVSSGARLGTRIAIRELPIYYCGQARQLPCPVDHQIRRRKMPRYQNAPARRKHPKIPRLRVRPVTVGDDGRVKRHINSGHETRPTPPNSNLHCVGRARRWTRKLSRKPCASGPAPMADLMFRRLAGWDYGRTARASFRRPGDGGVQLPLVRISRSAS